MLEPKSLSCCYELALLTTFLLLTALPLAAGETNDGLTPHDIARLQSVIDAALAPDGERIAYVVDVPRQPMEDEDGKSWHELHVVGTDGEDPRAFVTGERVGDVAWRPASATRQAEISFLAKREGDETDVLYVISPDGGEARKFLALDSDVTGYSWSPDGELVAVLATDEETEARKKEKEQGFDRKVFEEEHNPVKVWISDGEEGDPRSLDLEGHARGVDWSPAGDLLAVKISPGSGPDDGLIATKIQLVDPVSGEVKGRIDNPGKLGDLAWSPDGEHLAMIASADPADPGAGRLMVAGSGGGELTDLLPGLEAHVNTAAWTDDGHLVFVVAEGVETWIGTIAADGTGKSTVLAAGGPIWSGMSRAADGGIALVGSTPDHPSELFYLAAGAAAANRLSDSNPWLGDLRLAKQEVVRYSARDGLELEGLLIRPLDEESGRRYPLVMIVHGGPESHFSNGWLTGYSRPGQALAARGIAAFYPNYRASTGRGVEFSKLDHGDPAGKEFDDLVDGVDHLIASGLVDGDHVGVTGGSYGGFATAWCSTYYSERFAAGVMFVGISNNTSKLGTSDIPVELYQVHSRKWPWTDWDFFLERSPIRYVEKARTPLLIAGGEDDPRVHPSQSLQLYRYLKLLGNVPVRLVLYPGEKHGNQRAASRLDFNLRLMRWMEHYLQGEGGEPPPAEIGYGADQDSDG
ncbi:MAG: S9 family peptidase [Thermoanaerobaculia bacterium]